MIFLQELRAFCPWFHSILVASAALQQNDVKKAGPSGNSVALAAAAICREITSNFSSSVSDICSAVSQWREAWGFKKIVPAWGDVFPLTLFFVRREKCHPKWGWKKFPEETIVWKRQIEENKAALLEQKWFRNAVTRSNSRAEYANRRGSCPRGVGVMWQLH